MNKYQDELRDTMSMSGIETLEDGLIKHLHDVHRFVGREEGWDILMKQTKIIYDAAKNVEDVYDSTNDTKKLYLSILQMAEVLAQFRGEGTLDG